MWLELGIGVSVDTLGLLPRLDTLPIRWGVVLPEFLSFSVTSHRDDEDNQDQLLSNQEEKVYLHGQ